MIRERFSNYKGFVQGEGFPGPGNIEVHYNSIGFVKGKENVASLTGGTVQGFRKQRQRGVLILHGYPQRGSKDTEGDVSRLVVK